MASGLGLSEMVRQAVAGGSAGQQQLLSGVQYMVQQKLQQRQQEEQAQQQQDMQSKSQAFQIEQNRQQEADQQRRFDASQQLEGAKAGLIQKPIIERDAAAQRIVESPRRVRESPVYDSAMMVPTEAASKAYDAAKAAGVDVGSNPGLMGSELEAAYADPANASAAGRTWEQNRSAGYGHETGKQWVRDPSTAKTVEPKQFDATKILLQIDDNARSYGASKKRHNIDAMQADLNAAVSQAQADGMPLDFAAKRQAAIDGAATENDRLFDEAYRSERQASIQRLIDAGVPGAADLQRAIPGGAIPGGASGQPQQRQHSDFVTAGDATGPYDGPDGEPDHDGDDAAMANEEAMLDAELARLQGGGGGAAATQADSRSSMAPVGPQYPTQYLTAQAQRQAPAVERQGPPSQLSAPSFLSPPGTDRLATDPVPAAEQGTMDTVGQSVPAAEQGTRDTVDGSIQGRLHGLLPTPEGGLLNPYTVGGRQGLSRDDIRSLSEPDNFNADDGGGIKDTIKNAIGGMFHGKPEINSDGLPAGSGYGSTDFIGEDGMMDMGSIGLSGRGHPELLNRLHSVMANLSAGDQYALAKAIRSGSTGRTAEATDRLLKQDQYAAMAGVTRDGNAVSRNGESAGGPLSEARGGWTAESGFNGNGGHNSAHRRGLAIDAGHLPKNVIQSLIDAGFTTGAGWGDYPHFELRGVK